jgi:hypothetical protein
MSFFKHFVNNIKTSLNCFILFVFHLIHAFIPIKITSHGYWGILHEKE